MRKASFSFLAAGLLVAAGAAPAFAQSATGFSLDRFEPAERGSEWFVLDSVDWAGELRPAIGVDGDLAIHPLVIYNADDSVRANLSSQQFFVHIGGSLTIHDIFRLGINVPIALVNSGDSGMIGTTTFVPPDSAALGDIRLGAAVRVYGKPGDGFRFALGLQVFVPTGSKDQFTGDGSVRVLPHLMAAGDAGKFLYALRAGVLIRAADTSYDGAPVSHEVQLAGSVGVRITPDIMIGPEVYLGTTISDTSETFKSRTTPFEALLGLHFRASKDWRIGVGAGLGLTRGLGEPAERIVASLEWSPAIVVENDRDHDGILDKDDACPDVPGIHTDDPKTNGCPPSDRDHDGILDQDDACPDVPGIKTDDPKTNGCPPPSDRDGDGILDQDDACPDVPGIKTDDPKTNGCPPPKDTDGDGIIDELDACPTEPGPADPDPKKNGCPLAHIDVEKHQIVILQQVKFAFDKADILPESNDILQAVFKILDEHQEITKIHIEGHTDNKGSAKYNKGLSDRRSKSVMKWLVQHGIKPSRMTAKGYGLERPIDTNDTDEGRQNNRRVEFHIEGGAGNVREAN